MCMCVLRLHGVSLEGRGKDSEGIIHTYMYVSFITQ